MLNEHAVRCSTNRHYYQNRASLRINLINSSLYQVRWHLVTSQSFNIYQQTSFSSSTKQRLILIQTMKLLESSIKKNWKQQFYVVMYFSQETTKSLTLWQKSCSSWRFIYLAGGCSVSPLWIWPKAILFL